MKVNGRDSYKVFFPSQWRQGILFSLDNGGRAGSNLMPTFPLAQAPSIYAVGRREGVVIVISINYTPGIFTPAMKA